MQYEHTDEHHTVKRGNDGLLYLANFKAEITKQTKIVDGLNERIILTVEGTNKNGKLRPVEIEAKKFASMSWVTEFWGMKAVIFPEPNVLAELRTAIMVMSENTVEETIYQHTGWIETEGQDVYLHASGAIGKEGNDTSVKVQLPADLSRFDLPTITMDDDAEMKDHFYASLELLKLSKTSKMAPMWCSIWRAILGGSDFATHCTGRSGSFKSEVTSLMASHFGSGMDARHLPGSWSSTANAIEALAYRAKDALFVLDDFIPVGTSVQKKALEHTADRIMRAQGNQQGRARLTDVSALQETMYPRGLILSSGEDTPTGQSLRGRMMIVELSVGDVCTDKLTAAQAKRESYALLTSSFIQWLASNKAEMLKAFKAMALENRECFKDHGHTRTPQLAADLLAAAELFFQYGLAMGFLDQDGADKYKLELYDALKATAIDQTRFIVESDPCETFVGVLRSGFMAGRFHLRAVGGGSPDSPADVGWAEDSSGTVYSYKPRGALIGWIDEEKDTIYLEAAAGYEEIKKQSGGSIALTATTLWKRLREGGVINAVDEKRQRNTIRLTVKKVSKTVASIALSRVIEKSEEEETNDGTF